MRDRDELEELFPESSTQLVSLNTRIPRNVSNLIDECVGILQLASKHHKVTKQEAVTIILENGIEAIREAFVSMDRAESEVAVSEPITVELIEKPKEITGENIASKQRETISRTSYDMKAYAEMSNKSFYTPHQKRANSADSEIARKLQSKLGLR